MEDKEVKEKKCFSRWNGWFSPIGVAVLILSCSASVFFLACAVVIIKSVFFNK